MIPQFHVHTKENLAKVWSADKLEQKLQNVISADNKTTWIRRNLNTGQPGFIGRLFWGVAKNWNWMRKTFFDVDYERSQKILGELYPQIQKAKHSNPKLYKLYKDAVMKFNTFSPHHTILLPSESPTHGEFGETPPERSNIKSYPEIHPFSPEKPSDEISPPILLEHFPYADEEVEGIKNKINLALQKKNISKQEAVKILKEKPGGTFFISSEDKGFAIWYVSKHDNKPYRCLAKDMNELEMQISIHPDVFATPLKGSPKGSPIAEPKKVETDEDIEEKIKMASHGLAFEDIPKGFEGKSPGSYLIVPAFGSMYVIFYKDNTGLKEKAISEEELVQEIKANPHLYKYPIPSKEHVAQQQAFEKLIVKAISQKPLEEVGNIINGSPPGTFMIAASTMGWYHICYIQPDGFKNLIYCDNKEHLIKELKKHPELTPYTAPAAKPVEKKENYNEKFELALSKTPINEGLIKNFLLTGKPVGTFFISQSLTVPGEYDLYIVESKFINSYTLTKEEIIDRMKKYPDYLQFPYYAELFMNAKKEPSIEPLDLGIEDITPSVKKVAPSIETPDEIVKKADHGKIDTAKTKELLAGQPEGTFLIRDSATIPFCKVFACVGVGGFLQQIQLLSEGGGYVYKGPFGDENKFYATLGEFLTDPEYKDAFKIPLIPKTVPPPIVPKVETPQEIINKAFHGNINAQLTKNILTNKPPGTFLVRNSSTSPGTKVFAFVTEIGTVEQLQIHPEGSGYIDHNILGQKKEFFPTLGDILQHPEYKKIFVSPIPPLSNEELINLAHHGEITNPEIQELFLKNPIGSYVIVDDKFDPNRKLIIFKEDTGKPTGDTIICTKVKPSGYHVVKTHSLSNHLVHDLGDLLDIPEYKKALQYPIPPKKPAIPAAEKPLFIQPAVAKISPGFPPPPKDGLPPIPKSKPPSPSIKYLQGRAVQDSLSKGADPNELLIEAFKKEQPEICAWLLKNGAALSALDKIADKTASQMELSQWLSKVIRTTEVTAKTVDDLAIGLGLGYKSANLMVLQAQAAEMSKKLENAEVKVPPFMAIGDFEMQQYLMKAIPELQDLWNQFLDSFDPVLKSQFMDSSKDTAEAARIPLKISEKGQQIIDEIHRRITGHFESNPYYTLQISEWLKKENPEFIIVRSTGKEDSDTNSNAGGNESIPFIKPDPTAISEAMGKVIASYFGEKSVGQRLLAGDRSLFNEKKPFIPVLLQTMIGENVGGAGSKNEDIPRSGVLFTRQQDKAQGVTFIQTGLGNNEGIVSSRVGVDSYYVGEDKNIHAVVRQKGTRFVSVQEGGSYKCEPIKNNDKVLERSQALPDGVILDLKQVADDVSRNYGEAKGIGVKAMDMEYTVKLRDKGSDKPVIYLLQARPLLDSQQGKKPVEKSFLDLKTVGDIPRTDKMNVETLLDGNAYVRTIEKPQDVLFADDITTALKEYTKADADKIKAIVIKKTAPVTSHEAVVLRPKGVAVIVVQDPENFERVKKMADQSSPQKPLLIDPQRGMIVDTHKVPDPKAIVKKGMISYPVPLEFSIPRRGIFFDLGGDLMKDAVKAQLSIKLGIFNEEYLQLINDLKGDKDFLPLSSKANPKGYSIRGLLDEMAMAEDPLQAKLALATLLNILYKRLHKSMHDVEKFRSDINQMMFSVFEAAVEMSKKEIGPALEKHPAQSLERLYPIKFLDALIFQGGNENVVGQFSYSRVLTTEVTEKKEVVKAQAEKVEYKGPHAKKLLQMQVFGANSFSPECQNNWKEFTNAVMKAADKQPALIENAIKLMNQVNAMKLSPIWLNVIFNKEWISRAGQANRAENVLEALAQIQQKNEATLNWVNEKNDKLMTDAQIQEWGKPEFVKKNAAKLRNEYIKDLGFDKTGGKNSLKAMYDAADEFGRLALMQYLRRAVIVYDEAIKAMKGSDQYSNNKQKAKDFAEMLQGYFDMMEASMRLISYDDEKKMMKPEAGKLVTFHEYIKDLHGGRTYNFGFLGQGGVLVTTEGFDKLLQNAREGKLVNPSLQFEARPEFAVDSFVIGSKADLNFSSHWPKHLEEYFTTFHQNMEKVAKFLNTKHGLNENILSGQAKNMAVEIRSQFKQDISGFTTDKSNLEVEFQIPLRQHSSKLSLSYDTKAPEKGMDLTVNMFGNDEHDRWDQSATVGAILANMGGLSFAGGIPPKINYNGKREAVSFTLHVPPGYPDAKNLIAKLVYTLTIMTKDENMIAPETFKSKINTNLGTIDWKKMNEKFFADSFYMNTKLMDDFYNAKDTGMVVKIAKNSLLGLARQKVKDYTLHAYPSNLAGYYNDPKYAYVPGNTTAMDQGLRLGAALQLIRALQNNPIAAQDAIRELIEDPDMKQQMPDMVKALQESIKGVKSPMEQIAEFVKQGKLGLAYDAAQKSNDAVLKLHGDNLIAEALKNKADAIVMAKELYEMGLIDEANTKILSKIKLDEADKNWFNKQGLQKARKALLNDLPANANLLMSKGASFDTNYKQIMDLCAKGLIGLSQHTTFHENYGTFSGLENYLGKPKYDYVYDNKHLDTGKLRKAAPLYIIRGLESKKFEIHNEAFQAMDKLIKDYIAFGKGTPQAKDYETAIFAIMQGYHDALSDKKEALRVLSECCHDDMSVLIKCVSQAGGKMSPGIFKEILVEAAK